MKDIQYIVALHTTGTNKIRSIKIIREALGIGLVEAKKIYETASVSYEGVRLRLSCAGFGALYALTDSYLETPPYLRVEVVFIEQPQKVQYDMINL